MSYIGPSYLRKQGLLPEPKTIHPALTMSKIDAVDFEEKDPWKRKESRLQVNTEDNNKSSRFQIL
jgi:hypothetical protein